MKRTATFLMLLLMAGAAIAQGEFVCGDTVRDGNGNEYATVRIGALCWTKSNMRAVSYADGTPIAKAMIYNSERYNDTVSNLANFGRLYSWWSAVNVPEGGDAKPEKDTAGFVQGVCPEGWHIPTVEEMNDLRNNPEEDLHSTDFWVLPNANTNSTGFSEVPGGKFSAELDRFEGLYTNSYMWTDSATSSEWVVACNSRYFCNKASEESVRKGDGLSVRCVKLLPALELVGPSDTIVCAEGAVAVTYQAVIKNADISRYTFAWKVNGVDSSATGSTLTVNYTVDDTATSPHLIECQTVSRIPMTAEVSTNLSLQEASEVKMLHSICYPYKLIVQYQILNYDSTDLVESGIIYATKSDMSDAVSITADIKPDTNGIFTIETVLDGYNVCDTTWFTAWYSGRCVSGVSCDTLFEKVVPDPTDCGTVTDVDGNVYNTVMLGDQCWLKENLRTKHFRDGSPITRGMDYATDTSSVNPFYYMPTAEEVAGYDFETYGLYYNFPATIDAKGICPEGWHVPTMGEWDEEARFVALRCEYTCGPWSGWAKSMAAPVEWKKADDNECQVGYEVSTNNSSGYTAYPMGMVNVNGYLGVGSYAYLRSSSEYSNKYAYGIRINSSHYSNGMKDYDLKYFGIPIRCLKNDTVVCSTTDAKPCPGTPTVTDQNGNVYNTVQIGHQCWTKENMRATTLPSGRELTSPDTVSYNYAHYYDNTASSILSNDRGLLYNWAAAMDTVFADSDDRNINFENRRGICPEGWHVPNASEWIALEEYLKTQGSCYDCGDNERYYAKSLASDEYWKNSTNACAVGKVLLDNNKTGFTAIPVGQYVDNSFSEDGEYANFWSSTGMVDSSALTPYIYNAYNYYLKYDLSAMGDDQENVSRGLSVRCLKNTPAEDAQPCPGMPTVTDIDGNVYNTVQIGHQCWTKENLRTTKFRDGSNIPQGLNYAVDKSDKTPYFYEPDSTATDIKYYTFETYGHYYNYPAAVDSRKICPEGWHVPSDEDWTILSSYVGSKYMCGGDAQNIAKSLASKTLWSSSLTSDCVVGKNRTLNDTTGFSALPVGVVYTSFSGDDYLTAFWSTTEKDDADAWIRDLHNYSELFARSTYRKDVGISIRCLKGEEPTTTCPTVTTGAAEAAADNAVKLAGTVADITGTVEANGFVYGDSEAVLASTVGNEGSSDESLEATITGLTPCDTIWYAAFTKTSDCDDYVYGDTMWFKVPAPAPDITTCGKVKDHQNNEYSTVKIGTQCWMAENMRATTSPKTGHNIPTNSRSRLSPYFYEITSPTFTLNETGVLYNWAAAMDTSFTAEAIESLDNRRGICPEGWHVPSQADWNTLINTVNSNANCNVCGTGINNIAKALASTEGWETVDVECQVGNDQASNNSTGFTTIPTGYRSVSISGEGKQARFWSSTNHSTSAETVYGMMLNNNLPNVSVNSGYDKNLGLSVRCVKDQESTTTCPTVTTGAAAATADNAVKLAGTVADITGTVEANGFIYGDSKATLTDTVAKESGDDENLSATITDLTPCDTIWYAAFTKTSDCDDYVYGDTLFFRVPAPAPDTTSCGTARDHEGNTYKTVKIGEQCWMAENLRTTTSPSTRAYLIPAAGTSATYTGKQARWNNDDSATYAPMKYGLLYNWNAAIDTFNTAFAETGASTGSAVAATFTGYRRGICPEGWHLPSDEEWTQLTNYVSSQCGYVCGGNNNYIAKALTSATEWNSSTSGECTPGDQSVNANNIAGFGTLPAGYYVSSFAGMGNYAYFWSSTQYSNNQAWQRNISNSRSQVTRYRFNKNACFSVRCVKDQELTTTCPTVTTGAAAATADNAVKLTGTVADITGTVEANGFVYGESKSALTSTKDNEGSSDESLEATISGATPCDTIWYAAFTKTSDCDDYVYGDTLFFKVPAPAPDITSCGTVMDHEDNTYKTVKIGKQCWMAENMRATTSPKTGTAIPTNGRARVNPYSYVITSPTFTLNETGVLYNWAAAMDTSFTTEAIESLDNRKGICPEGWHVPSQADWNTLISTVNADADCNVCGTGINNIAKALASTEGWETFGTECAAGNDPASNNSTGFTTIPTGYRVESISGEGKQARFWSSTNLSTGAETVYGMMLNYNFPNVSVNSGYDKNLGLSVRCVKDQESTTTCPSVTTVAAAATADNAVKLAGTVADITGTVEANGFAYGESKAALANTVANASGSNESLSAVITAATPCDTIWYAAFTKTSDCDDYVYGDTMWFKVPAPAPDITTCGKVKDHQNNEYSTVKIGNQCWMAENMRATTSPKTGTAIPTNGRARVNPYSYVITSPTFTLNETGVLYNWAAAMDTSFTTEAIESLDNRKGICPEGWHVPSQADWNTLINTVKSNANCNVCGTGINNIAKALASTSGWETFDTECAVGNDPASNNSTGFTTIPTGYRSGAISGEGKHARFWSSTNHSTSSETVYGMMLNNNLPNVSVSSGYDKNLGLSVRCVKDVSTTPTVVIDEKSCSEANTVTDHEGNVYATVKIGGQCWMRENLRTTKTPSGSDIALGSERYCPNNDVNNVAEYGYLYTWTAMMNGAGSSGENPSGVQGICPTGWHVPSIREWGQLLSYLRNQDIYRCNNNSSYIAKALASTSGWNSSTEDCAVGNDQSSNNAAGFGALPAGIYCPDGSMSYPFSSGYNGFGNMVYFWSSTLRASDYGTTYSLHSMFAGVGGSDLYTSDAMSVRCLKDN